VGAELRTLISQQLHFEAMHNCIFFHAHFTNSKSH